ncbi:Transcription factor GTE11 [Zea mays]|uniref:Transcription factor GTE11 n=2 Tax=Zea mays TaxID=4577 RepID=A0A3L6FN56_MAIZE|nr:Transcription factor GTE11 [Zea mays]
MKILGGNVSEKQVSPDKQIRVALLRSRFADIRSLRLVKRPLIRLQRRTPRSFDTKGRNLRGYKEKRELGCKLRLKLQRTFARGLKQQLLMRLLLKLSDKENLTEKQLAKLCKSVSNVGLQMEKTVDINEGIHFLKDLEMLGSVTGEQIPNLVGETSPGFQMGSNTLEKLGLYVKNDEDDEDGDFTDEPVADVEEGEIARQVRYERPLELLAKAYAINSFDIDPQNPSVSPCLHLLK